MVGVVVIGRNEGERLRICLKSLSNTSARVYVDSGSTDGSQALAAAMGFHVLDLDTKIGFTAARARNAGFLYLTDSDPELDLIQFVDGDCEVCPDWIGRAVADINRSPDIAAVFGRRRERFPERNIYHQACEIEWQVPPGDVTSCGGDALFRTAALRDAGGYNDNLIAGEEPELCLRLRKKGWRIVSNDRDMTLHDVAIDRFSQWWRRAKRAGFGLSNIADMHGADADPAWRRFAHSTSVWCGILALTLLSFAWLVTTRSMLGAIVFGALLSLITVQILRTAFRDYRKFSSIADSVRWSALIFLSKPAQLEGRLSYLLERRRKRGPKIIEYK